MSLITTLKKSMIGLLTAGSTVLIAACYGVMREEFDVELTRGKVIRDQEGVAGVEVCVTTLNQEPPGILLRDKDACTTTTLTGRFSISVPLYAGDEEELGGIKVCVYGVEELESPASQPYCKEFAEPVFPETVILDLDALK